MDGFDDTLGRILGDPSAMARIAKLAQSLGGPSPPPSPPPIGDSPPPSPSDAPPPGENSLPPPPPPVGTVPPQSTPPIPGLSGSNGLPDLAGLYESPLLRKLLPLLLEGRQNAEARRFLYALRPYLSPRRQENVERALQLARLIRVGQRFLSEQKGRTGGTEGV